MDHPGQIPPIVGHPYSPFYGSSPPQLLHHQRVQLSPVPLSPPGSLYSQLPVAPIMSTNLYHRHGRFPLPPPILGLGRPFPNYRVEHPPQLTASPNRIRFQQFHGPFGVPFSTFPPPPPTHYFHPRGQVPGVPSFVMLPQPPPDHCFQTFSPPPGMPMLPPPMAFSEGSCPIGVQLNYYPRQPLFYGTDVETPPTSPSTTSSYNTQVHYADYSSDPSTGTDDYRDIQNAGIQNYTQENDRQQFSKNESEDTETDPESRTATANSTSSEIDSKCSWSEMMDSEDNSDETKDCKPENAHFEKYTIDSADSNCKEGGAKSVVGSCGSVVNTIVTDMNDCGDTFLLYGEEFPYVANCYDERISSTLKLPENQYSYYVPPTVPDDDFFGGQHYVWQQKMMESFGCFPEFWRIQALPDFDEREAGWHNFTLTSKLRFCCRNCMRPWTSMRGQILFSLRYDEVKQSGTILMKIFGQICMHDDCSDNDLQTPACYPEEIHRVAWKLSELVGYTYYGIPMNSSYSGMLSPPIAYSDGSNPIGLQLNYYAGQPLFYATDAETPPTSPSTASSQNTQVYYGDCSSDPSSGTNGYRDFQNAGIRKYSQQKNIQQFSKNESGETETDKGSRPATANSNISGIDSKCSWSKIMDCEDNADATKYHKPDSARFEKYTINSANSKSKSYCKIGRIKSGIGSCGSVVNAIVKDMKDCGDTFLLYGDEFPYVANCWDEQISSTLKIPENHYSYYVPPTVPDDDFFGGQHYVWQQKMMESFGCFPEFWRIQALPDFDERKVGWHNFTLTSKLRFCCRNCIRPWTSMRGKILFSLRYDEVKQSGTILMKIFGQICMQDDCNDNDFQTPACYPEEIHRLAWKLSELVGYTYYGVPMNSTYSFDPNKAVRIGNPASPHRKELCQACQKGMCSKI